ncbi:MAG TPA: serine/threonine-protein phosphatase, partial [Bacteroidetes bacterium]|nr:serine/threonine-protein phosphatase [Bacteroidota bacterium]
HEGGLILGVEPGARFQQVDLQLAKGDLIFLYTDGVTEAMNPQEEEFGEERLKDLLFRHKERSPEEILKIVSEEIQSFTGTASFESDDVTMFALKIN